MISRRQFVAGSALAGFFSSGLGTARSAEAASGSLPWRNWSGGLLANPAGRFAPASEEELSAWIRSSAGPLRPVGAAPAQSPMPR